MGPLSGDNAQLQQDLGLILIKAAMRSTRLDLWPLVNPNDINQFCVNGFLYPFNSPVRLHPCPLITAVELDKSMKYPEVINFIMEKFDAKSFVQSLFFKKFELDLSSCKPTHLEAMFGSTDARRRLVLGPNHLPTYLMADLCQDIVHFPK